MSYSFELITPREYGKGLSLPVWAMPEFMLAIAELHGVEPMHLVVTKGNETSAVFPIFERARFGLKNLVCPVMAYYQPLVFGHDPGAGYARKLLDESTMTSGIAEVIHKHYRRAQFNLSPANMDVRGFTWEGYKATPLYTFEFRRGDQLVPVRDESEKLKKASKRGYSYREEYLPEQFISLLKDLYQRKGHRLGISYDRLTLFLDRLHRQGILLQDNIFFEDRMVSSNILYRSADETVYAIMRATDQAEMQYGVSNLHTKLMLDNLRDEFSGVDFCGANVREVARFKAAMGLKLKVFYRISGIGGIL